MKTKKIQLRRRDVVNYERKILFTAIGKYQDIIDCKRNDSKSCKSKEQAWKRITAEFNADPNVRRRLIVQLKRLYENTKYKGKIVPNTDPYNNNDDNLFLKQKNTDEQLSEISSEDLNVEEISEIPNRNFVTENSKENVNEIFNKLSPIILARQKQSEESFLQQKLLQDLAIKKERMHISMLEEQIKQSNELHELKMRNEREYHEQRMKKLFSP